ncbi:universal stress protein [Salinicola salarius]|uniref:universal stress protein n=1 Tax=Salinicola salarius TaxID=430457 RepID=UPI0023E3D0E0|nr:universal stress protein [Salinicola salarius]MDF3920240.1 universal stress protein [Salinicola salarius]
MTQQILVPIDGSVSARQALAHACLVQRATQARIHLLHVPEVPVAKDALGAKVGAAPADYTPEKGRLLGERLLEEAWQAMCGDSDQVTYHVVEGQPVETIVRQATELGVDMIIMGSRGLSNLKSLAVGSVSHKVAHLAPCAVLTLHVPG